MVQTGCQNELKIYKPKKKSTELCYFRVWAGPAECAGPLGDSIGLLRLTSQTPQYPKSNTALRPQGARRIQSLRAFRRPFPVAKWCRWVVGSKVDGLVDRGGEGPGGPKIAHRGTEKEANRGATRPPGETLGLQRGLF